MPTDPDLPVDNTEQLATLQRQIEDLTYRMNTHDHTHTTLTKTLDGGKVYSMHVNTSGSSTFMPAGWTITGGVTGQKTITHNLGTTNYAVAGVVLPQNTVTVINIDSVTATSFLVKTLNQTGATTWSATNTDIYLIVSLNG